MRYRINEIFYSIQGEGAWTGTPMAFVRFAGCNLKCDFCDTAHKEYTEMTDLEIIETLKTIPAERICLTGGEPSLQITKEFIELLHRQGKIIHIETNGLTNLPLGIDWITVSPKTLKIRLLRADEIKIVYQGQNVADWVGFDAKHHFLQPLSCSNTEEVVEYILSNPKWRISLQTHKMLNVQ